jgi:hypothetical protein
MGCLLFASSVQAHDGPHDHAGPGAARMAATANSFLKSLTPEQRERTIFPMDSSATVSQERSFWQYIPSDDIPGRYGHPRRGLTLKEMTPHQKHLASALLSAGLTQQGYIKATTIMSLEDVLRIIENDTKSRRDPEKYHFSIFGEPSADGTWAYRIEGHHVSLHFTVVKGRAVGAPTFFGSNPAEVRTGPRAGLRILGAEEDKARALLDSLTPAQRKTAIVAETAYPDILTTNDRQAALKGQPSGLEASQMNPAQRKLLHALITEYIDNVSDEMAEKRRKQLAAAGVRISFAWAGPVQRGAKHYYRVQAPAFLIEYDNTQNEGNHVHAVWRDFQGDWGRDLLQEHYKSASASHGHDHK